MPVGNFRKGLQFAVGAPTRRSSVWTLVVHNAGDVYIIHSWIGAVQKVRQQHSGDYRLQWTDAQIKREPWLLDPVNRRMIDRWSREVEQVPGVEMAYAIVVPDSELADRGPLRKDPSQITWVNACGSGDTMILYILFTYAIARGYPTCAATLLTCWASSKIRITDACGPFATGLTLPMI